MLLISVVICVIVRTVIKFILTTSVQMTMALIWGSCLYCICCSRSAAYSALNSWLSFLQRVAKKLCYSLFVFPGFFSHYFVPGRGVKYCNQRICMFVSLSVCPLAYLKNHMSKFHQILYTCYMWPRLDTAMRAVQYVMYFRFCGWRHVSIYGGNKPESKTTRMFRVRQVPAPVERQTTLFGWDRRVAAPGQTLPSPTASCSFCFSAELLRKLQINFCEVSGKDWLRDSNQMA